MVAPLGALHLSLSLSCFNNQLLRTLVPAVTSRRGPAEVTEEELSPAGDGRGSKVMVATAVPGVRQTFECVSARITDKELKPQPPLCYSGRSGVCNLSRVSCTPPPSTLTLATPT